MNQKHKGTTLIELVISIVIVGIALLGTLICMNTVSLYSSDPILLEQAIAIADSYLQEISSKSFPITPCPTPTPTNTRPYFANICNYNGLSQVPTDRTGTALAGLGGYTVNVTVDTSTATLNGLSGSNVVARIDVSVSHNAISTIRLSNYVTN